MAVVALLARAWIEISTRPRSNRHHDVALLARAWIEITTIDTAQRRKMVALLARAWIEILLLHTPLCVNQSRSPCESVD